MDKKEEFLTIFRELEEEIVKISGLDEGYVSFNRALSDLIRLLPAMMLMNS